MYSLFVHVFFTRLEEHLTVHRWKHLCHSMGAHRVGCQCSFAQQIGKIPSCRKEGQMMQHSICPTL